MFDCKKCEALTDEVENLRASLSKSQEQTGKLVDRLIAVTSPDALAMLHPEKSYDPKDYYGNEDDEMIEFDEFGQKIIKVKGQGEEPLLG